jgi:malate dehydrogenase (oxaloacetate-decarboxylating)(NADP+)
MRMARYQDALAYHSGQCPGKVAITVTKPCASQHDLSFAYTPGVAEPVRAIHADPEAVFRYTAKGNLVAVVSNGTAVLGLGNVGPLASKPVMEGKALLFKRFADIDAFDLEIDAPDPDQVIRIVRALEPTFGGINLEDIKAPECFAIEEALRATMDIPVFHDDQHGTAVILAAALLNAVELAGKRLDQIRVVISGAGASAIASARFFRQFGVVRDQLLMVDTSGVIYQGRRVGMTAQKTEFAVSTPARTLADALRGADVFVGLSVGGIVTPEMLGTMAATPIVLAMANPDPEIAYDDARAARPDAIVATGRSDCPNQVNNVLGFPFIFRGALDVRARAITEEMKAAASRAIAALAREAVPEVVLQAYNLPALEFGRDYLLPKPLDPRLPLWVAPAVVEAAMAGGVARLPVDLKIYREGLVRRFTTRRERVIAAA